jgi:hypothetical protein
VQFSSQGDTQGGLQIDINNPALAARFIQAKKDSTVGDQGAILVLEPANLRKFDNTGDFQAPTAASITLTGNWGGIGSAFLLKGAGAPAASCPTTAPSDSVAGTVSGSSITFPSVTLPGSTGATTFFEVCLVTNAVPGSTIIQANPKTTVALGAAGATLITGGTSTGLDAYDYNGNAQVLQYSGDFGGTYQFFVRLVNNTNAVANVFAVAQSDSGATGTAQIESSMAVNTNDLIPASTIFGNAGVVLPDTGRGSLTILAPAGVFISQVLLNPDGSVANIQ